MTSHGMAKRKTPNKEFHQMWAEARKDPNFIKEMKAFVKASTGVYKLPRNFFTKTS